MTSYTSAWNLTLKQSSEFLLSDHFKKRVVEEDETMIKMIPMLSKINLLGYLTTNSQQGRIEKFSRQNKLHTMKERSYVVGLMLKSLAKKFIKDMNVMTDKCAIYVPIISEKCPIVSFRDLDIPLTIVKTGRNQPVIATHMSTIIPYDVVLQESEHVLSNTNLIKSNKIVYIFCWDPIWGREAGEKNGLFKNIINILKKYKK